MRLSHRKKLAHKRAGRAKGVFAERLRCFFSRLPVTVPRGPRSELRTAPKPPSFLARLAAMVAVPFRRLSAAGAAQRDLLRGR